MSLANATSLSTQNLIYGRRGTFRGRRLDHSGSTHFSSHFFRARVSPGVSVVCSWSAMDMRRWLGLPYRTNHLHSVNITLTILLN